MNRATMLFEDKDFCSRLFTRKLDKVCAFVGLFSFLNVCFWKVIVELVRVLGAEKAARLFASPSVACRLYGNRRFRQLVLSGRLKAERIVDILEFSPREIARFCDRQVNLFF